MQKLHRANVCPRSDCSGNLTGTQAPGTNIHMAGRAVNQRLNTLDIGLPGTIGTSVGVGNFDTKVNALVAEFALSHPLHLLAVTNIALTIYSQANDIIADYEGKCKGKFRKYQKI